MRGAVMETCAVDHSAGRGFVCVVQQVSIVVVVMLALMPRYRRQRFIVCFCSQSLPSLPHLGSGDIRGCSWNGGRRGLVFHNAGGADADLPQDSSLVMHVI